MTTAFLIELGWKSTLTLGATLALLQLLRHRSAAERSWLAHAGLLVTLLLPVVLLAAPRWHVDAPAPVATMLASAPVETVAVSSGPDRPVDALRTDLVAPAVKPTNEPHADAPLVELPTAWTIYGGPAALLLTLTLIAVARLFGLRRRASVLVENNWLQALAQAQRRMDFKHGTALLVSRDIHSPVSWGLLRPVILLNEAAIGSKDQAEAIIAHELAHVARLDWAKLLLARITTAVFWFNPFAWVLAKACHQLREEAADDAVLASDVPDLDYAELLVGVARHESGALLLAANGVAPSRGSLAQRVARVLDTSRRRAPARLGWTALCTLGTALFATPLAALSLATEPTPVKPVRTAALPTPAVAALPVPVQLATAGAPIVPAAPRAVAAPQSIGLPPFSAIALRGGGEIRLRHGAVQRVQVVAGDADAVTFAVAGDSLAISGCDGDCGRRLVLEVTAPRIDAIAINGSGIIKAQGTFPAEPDLAIAIMGGGQAEVRAIRATEVAAAIRGGGLIETSASGELAAQIRGGGAIRYWGNPEVASAVNGGGTVTRGGSL